uniref:Uncharacterized protein n=1 Tax=Anopheles atroparvus TaxID=41427 RepID=A0AAG5D2E0_ANOAO
MKALCASLILSILVLLAASHAHDIEKRAITGQYDETMQKIMERGMVFASGVIEKLKDSEEARKLIGKVLGAVGGRRAKRSIRVDTKAAHFNIAQYQKVEMYKTINNVSNGGDGRFSCPIDQNELNLIETVSIAVQQTLVEVDKIINGRKLGYLIPKPK